MSIGADEPVHARRWFLSAVFTLAMTFSRENECAAAVARRAQLCGEWEDYERHVAPCLDEYREHLPPALVAVMDLATEIPA